mmetsp:Transcript_103227/g.321678  ORF Transcript_103227/g.321678 Transcript_103227/m.321678 type:complete len:168 (+) Transcript_103227:241-744(+)
MTSTERTIALDLVARKNMSARERGGKKEAQQDLPDFLAGYKNWRGWNPHERAAWMQGQLSPEAEATRPEGAREYGSYDMYRAHKERLATAGVSASDVTVDAIPTADGYVVGTDIPARYKFVNGYGWDHGQRWPMGEDRETLDRVRGKVEYTTHGGRLEQEKCTHVKR